MDTSRQTQGRILWFAFCQPKRWYISSCRTTVIFSISPSPSGTSTDRGTAGELLTWWWGLSSSATPPCQPRNGQPWKSPVSAETFMVSCKVWHFLTSEGTFLKSYVNGDKHASWSYDVQNRNEKKGWGDSLDFKIGLEVDCMRQGRKETNSFDIFFSLHLVLATLWICCLLPFLSLQQFDYQLFKGYHSQILTWHISLFVHLRILNIFCTNQTFQVFSELYKTAPSASM